MRYQSTRLHSNKLTVAGPWQTCNDFKTCGAYTSSSWLSLALLSEFISHLGVRVALHATVASLPVLDAHSRFFCAFPFS